MRYYVRLLSFILLLSQAPGSLFELSAVETEVSISSGSISLSDINAAKWNQLPLKDKRAIAPRLLDLAIQQSEKRGPVLKLFESSSDSFISAHAEVARAIFKKGDYSQTELTRLESTVTGEARDVIGFYASIYDIRRSAIRAKDISCRVFEFSEACLFLKLRLYAEQLTAAPIVTAPQLTELQRQFSPFLLKNAIRPAFYHKLAEGFPETINRLRMPLEAAIFQERCLRGVTGPEADRVRLKIPFYLAAAGDFSSALKYTESRAAFKTVEGKLTRLDWMIFSARYQQAAQSLTELIEGSTDLSSVKGEDPWTGFRYSQEGLRLRLALVLHLAGDSSRAGRALEMLKDSKGTTDLGEPIALYSRVRMAQILLADRPELAHKLAEDVTFEAQAKNWALLEYQATIIDGWALYYSKQYFPAIVNFTKAAGIVSNPPSEYSRLLGMLVSQLAIAPASSQAQIIQRLRYLLLSKPYQPAIYTIRDWVPERARMEFFLEQLVYNHETRRDRLSALSTLVEYRRLEEFFFPVGSNPGGLRGIVSSDVWFRTLRDFPSMRNMSQGVFDNSIDSLRPLINQMLTIPPLVLAPDSAFLFVFDQGSRIVHYLVSPAIPNKPRLGRPIIREEIDRTDFQTLRASCRLGACTSSKLTDIQKAMELYPRLQVQRIAPLDVNYNRLFNKKTLVTYFYDPYQPMRSYRISGRIYRPACETPGEASQADSVISFSDSLFQMNLTGSAMLWPQGLDSRFNDEKEARPVYLRNFICGESRIRFWDLDRFWSAPPTLLLVKERRDDEELDRAFLRYAATGSAVMEVPQGFSSVDSAELLSKIKSTQSLPLAIQAMNESRPDSNVRLIFPGPYIGR